LLNPAAVHAGARNEKIVVGHERHPKNCCAQKAGAARVSPLDIGAEEVPGKTATESRHSSATEPWAAHGPLP